jgi:ubiquitin carboxyl-terminal hydrolase 10
MSFGLLQVILTDRSVPFITVVYHDGKEATKGHYVTEVKHDGVGQWLRFDDSIVRTVGDGQLFKYNLPRMPYLLMYRRADTFSASAPRPAGGNSSSPNTVGSGNTSGHSSGRK